MYIKMGNYTIKDENIKEEGYTVKLENTYSQAKRTNTLQMVKVLIGKVYTVNATLINVTSDEYRQIQKIALQPDISVQFYDDAYAEAYVTQSMYCPTIEATAKRQTLDGTILYGEIEIEFIANQAANN